MDLVMADVLDHSEVWRAIKAIHYTCPLLVFVYFLLTVTVSICTRQALSLKIKDQGVRRTALIWLMAGVIAIYVSSLTNTASFQGCLLNPCHRSWRPCSSLREL